MHALSSSELLDLWDSGRARGGVERGLLLVHLARPDLDRDARLDLPIGERDALLFALREATFGGRAAFTAVCECGERLEFELPLDASLGGGERASSAPIRVEQGAYAALCRLPTSRDLASVRGAANDVEDAVQYLLARCVLEAECQGQACTFAALPDEVVQAIVRHMREADPRAYVDVSLTCPACRRVWSEAVDIVACLWAELSAAALHILREVHVLADRYGWSEQSILELPASRRRLYLEMASA